MKLALIILGLAVLLGLIGLIVWYIFRKKIIEGFMTKHGIHVIPSKKTTYLKPTTIEKWTDDLVDFWFQAMNWDPEQIYKTIQGTRITMRDVDKLDYVVDGKTLYAVGLTQIETKRMVIATLPQHTTRVNKQRILSLFYHETSHIPVAMLGGFWTNEDSHALFKEKGL